MGLFVYNSIMKYIFTWLTVVGPYKRPLKAITGCPAFRMLVTDGDSMFNIYPAIARLAWKTASGSKWGES